MRFSRRSVRTPAVAGVAAAGSGFAVPAVAAPRRRVRPATPDTGSTPKVVRDLPALPELPQLVTTGGTTTSTSGTSLSQPPAAEELPTPKADHVAEDHQLDDTDVEIQIIAPQDRVAAMQQLDAASMFSEPAEPPLGATEGNTVDECS
jgi:hypothetical protein